MTVMGVQVRNTAINSFGSSMVIYLCLPSDINECSGTHSCDENAACSNTNGSYSCHCNTGWSGNGFNCTSKRSLFMATVMGIVCNDPHSLMTRY